MATITGSKRLLDISANAMAASNSMTYGGLNVATEQYVSTQLANLVSSAPGTLDTLNELAAALGDDPNFATTITNALAGKLSTGHDMTLTLNGDASGSATFTNMGNATLTVAVANDSHTHDGRYYTETEVNSLLSGKLSTSGKAADSNLLDGLDSSAYMRDNGWNTSPGQDADTQVGMSSDFSYANNAPHTGDLIRFGASGYSLQLSSAYLVSEGALSFRTRNGDASLWNPWREVWHTGNFNPASYLTTSGKAADSNLLDGINSTSFLRSDQADTMSGTLTITGSNGVSRLRIEGTTPTIDLDDADGDSFYIHVNANNFYILTDRNGGGNYGEWEDPHPLYLEADTNSTYLWGNKVGTAAYAATSAFDAAGSADAVNTRIDTDVLPAIPTNNNQLTNGAGYITDGNTGWNNSYGFITEASYIKAGGAGPSTENLNTVANSVVTGELEYRGFNLASSNRPPASDNANGVITVGQHSGNYNAQLAFSSDGNMYWRDNPSTSFGEWRTVWDSGNLSLSTLGYTGATNANYITNNNQLTNGAGYITGVSWAGVTGKPSTFTPSAHTHAITAVDGLQDALDEKQPAGSYAASNHNHTYNVNDAWLRDNGDNANVKLYGNSRQMVFRTDGEAEYASGIGGYAFVWMYGGDAASNRRMLLDHDGGIWSSKYGWLDSAFAAASHNHAGVYDPAGTGAAEAAAVKTWVQEQNYASDSAISTAIGTVTLASLGYTGATNANYITNNNQLTNGAGYLTSSNDRNYITDSRGAQRAPSYYNDRYAQWDFQNVSDTGVGGDGWHALLTVSKWSSFDPSHRQEQLIFSGDHLWRRTAISDADWGENKKVWDSGNLDAFVGASVSNDTITFTKASGGTVAVTTSDANTNTWRGIDDTPVNGQTAESISSNWAYDHVNASNPHGTTASDVGADAAGSADAVNSRIDTEVLPAIGAVTLATLGYTGATNANYITNNNQLTNGAGYITDGNTGWNNSYGFIASGDTQEPGAWGSATKFKSSGQIADADSGSHSLQLISDNGNDAFMALHVSGDYAVFFGLDGASNRLHTGGWSAGATSYQIFDTRDFSAADVANGVTAHGWGNHASAGYATEAYADASAFSYAGLVNTRIDEEVLPAIPTNNNVLTNGAGYLTSVPATLSGNRTIGGDLTVSGNQVITAGSNADVKFSVWSGTTYGIGMTSGVTYGALNDYAMTFCMNNESDRGFWWGYSGQTKSAGAMSLTTGGILTVASTITAGGDITAFSDARVKENIETIDNALDKVTQLRGVEYNRIGAEERSIGVIAQEVQEVLPEVVREGQDGMLSVAYGNITGVLIEAIKEQQKQIEELKAQLDGLTK